MRILRFILPALALGAVVPSVQAQNVRIPSLVSLSTVHMIDAGTGWALAGNAVYRTGDGGHTWSAVTPAWVKRPFNISPAFRTACRAWLATAVGPDPETSNLIVYRTVDCGRHWTSSVLPAAGEDGPLAVAGSANLWLFVSKGVGLGQNPYALWHSGNGGTHWSQVAHSDSTGASPAAFTGCNCTQALTFITASAGWSTGAFFAVPNRTWLWRTADGGRRWSDQSLIFPRGYTAPDTDPPVFFGARQGVLTASFDAGNYRGAVLQTYHTSDTGVSWHPTIRNGLKLGSSPFHAASWVTVRRGWVTNGTSLFSTADGGLTWTTLRHAFSVPVESLQFVNRATGFAVPQAAGRESRPRSFILVTHDGGKTWRSLTTVNNGTP